MDRGKGVAADERDRISDDFFRGRNASAVGSGLGLALVRRIARLHLGDVRCLEREGGGAVFEVHLREVVPG